MQLQLTLQHLPFSDGPDSLLYIDSANTPCPLSYQQKTILEYVHPQALHIPPTTVSEAATSPRGRTLSLDSTPSSIFTDHDQFQRLLSLAKAELSTEESYDGPGKTPTRTRKNSIGRTTPRSAKHARELELNRNAATRWRDRRKAQVERLQERCKKEQERMLLLTSAVCALQNEAAALRNEVMMHSFCNWGGLCALEAMNGQRSSSASMLVRRQEPRMIGLKDPEYGGPFRPAH